MSSYYFPPSGGPEGMYQHLDPRQFDIFGMPHAPPPPRPARPPGPPPRPMPIYTVPNRPNPHDPIPVYNRICGSLHSIAGMLRDLARDVRGMRDDMDILDSDTSSASAPTVHSLFTGRHTTGGPTIHIISSETAPPPPGQQTSTAPPAEEPLAGQRAPPSAATAAAPEPHNPRYRLIPEESVNRLSTNLRPLRDGLIDMGVMLGGLRAAVIDGTQSRWEQDEVRLLVDSFEESLNLGLARLRVIDEAQDVAGLRQSTSTSASTPMTRVSQPQQQTTDSVSANLFIPAGRGRDGIARGRSPARAEGTGGSEGVGAATEAAVSAAASAPSSSTSAPDDSVVCDCSDCDLSPHAIKVVPTMPVTPQPGAEQQLEMALGIQSGSGGSGASDSKGDETSSSE